MQRATSLLLAMFAAAGCANHSPSSETTKNSTDGAASHDSTPQTLGSRSVAADQSLHQVDPEQPHRDVAERFRPIFVLDHPGVYRPASVQTFVEASAIQRHEGGGWPQAHAPGSIDEQAGFIAGKNTAAMRLEPRTAAGFDPEHSDAWAKRRPPSVFYRWKTDFPWSTYSFQQDAGVEYVTLQYYFFCFFNDADFLANGGDHDGDWGCIDLALIVKDPEGKASWDSPIVHSAVFHNHGRQLWLDQVHDHKLDFHGTRLVVYLEGNSNEPWPNKGGNGFDGWPKPPGFKINQRFEKNTGVDIPGVTPREDRIARAHRGLGDTVVDYELLDLDPPDLAQAPALVRFVSAFEGQYGTYAPQPPGAPPDSPPQGPPFQTQMWERRYKYGNFTHWWEWRGGDSFVEHQGETLYAPGAVPAQRVITTWHVFQGGRDEARDDRQVELGKGEKGSVVVHLPDDLRHKVSFNLKHNKHNSTDRGRTGTLHDGSVVDGNKQDWPGFGKRIYLGELHVPAEVWTRCPDGFDVDLVVPR